MIVHENLGSQLQRLDTSFLFLDDLLQTDGTVFHKLPRRTGSFDFLYELSKRLYIIQCMDLSPFEISDLRALGAAGRHWGRISCLCTRLHPTAL